MMATAISKATFAAKEIILLGAKAIERTAARMRFPAAVAARRRKHPRRGRSQKPVAVAPRIAPSVFHPYARPTTAPWPEVEADCGPAISSVTAGKLNPKTIAAGSIASALVANCASTRPRNDSCVARRIRGRTSIRRGKKIRKASAASAVKVCVRANVMRLTLQRRCQNKRREIGKDGRMELQRYPAKPHLLPASLLARGARA